MHKSNEDCFYFLTSSCAKGLSCTYRHSPLALTCNVSCPAWTRGNCPDPACPLRHSTIQRPTVSNGILCFYENTPMGCLKVDCTFIHSRPRMNLRNTSTIRSPSTNLINKDTVKSSPTDIPQTVTVSEPSTTINQTPIVTVETPPKIDIPPPIVKTETTPRRIAVSSDNAKMNSSINNNTSLIKPITRHVITDSPKKNQEEISTNHSRLVANRNVVLDESTSGSSRKIVQGTSSNRVVVSSEPLHLSSKGKKNDIRQHDLVEQKNDTKKKKFKEDTQSNIPFPSSAASSTNRLLFMSSKETSSNNGKKPIRLNRDRLPAPSTSSGNSPISVSTLANEEKTSAGKGLPQADERRTSRIERFKNNPISPPRSIICSSSTKTTTTTTNNNVSVNSSTSRNAVTSNPNERKRTAPETTIKDLPPSKRASTSSSSQRKSPSRQTRSSHNESKYSSSSSINDTNRKKQADELVIKTAHLKNGSPTTITGPSLSPVRPRFTPQPIVPPSPLQPSTRISQSRQPPSVVLKQPLVPITAPSRTSTKTIEQISPKIVEMNISPPKSTVELTTLIITNEEDENELLDQSSDVVDTFALIDEALLEADNLLELM